MRHVVIHSTQWRRSRRRRREVIWYNCWLIQIHIFVSPWYKHCVPLYLQIQYIPLPPLQAQSSSNNIYRKTAPSVKRLTETRCTGALSLECLPTSDYLHPTQDSVSKLSFWWFMVDKNGLNIRRRQEKVSNSGIVCWKRTIIPVKTHPSSRSAVEHLASPGLFMFRALQARGSLPPHPRGRGPSGHISQQHWARQKEIGFTVTVRERKKRERGSWKKEEQMGVGGHLWQCWRLKKKKKELFKQTLALGERRASRHRLNTLHTS